VTVVFRITHTHPEGIDGAVLQAVAVGYLLASEPQRQLDPEGMAATLRRYLQTAAFQSRLSQLLDLLAGGGDAGELGTGIEARNSVATALYCQLHQPDSFPAAVSAAISLGGDTDTITAMTGALAGARLGASAIPARWQQVEGAELLQELAAGFLARWRAGAA
jgi:poly(ADP-ribose) glycohydrolase ARH3